MVYYIEEHDGPTLVHRSSGFQSPTGAYEMCKRWAMEAAQSGKFHTFRVIAVVVKDRSNPAHQRKGMS